MNINNIQGAAKSSSLKVQIELKSLQ